MGKKEPRLEGAGISQLKEMIKHIGHNNDFTMELATVTSPLPLLAIKLDNMNAPLTKEFLICSESVYEKGFSVGDRVIVSSIEDGQSFIILDKAVMM